MMTQRNIRRSESGQNKKLMIMITCIRPDGDRRNSLTLIRPGGGDDFFLADFFLLSLAHL